MTLPKASEFTGLETISVEKDSCTGCYFLNYTCNSCQQIACSAHERDDKRTVIFTKKETRNEH